MQDSSQFLTLLLKDSSFCRILHEDLHHPYQIHIAHKLIEQYKVSSLQFCTEFLDLVNNNHDTVNTLLISDEARFHAWVC